MYLDLCEISGFQHGSCGSSVRFSSSWQVLLDQQLIIL